jgi:dienelactone hydrolase
MAIRGERSEYSMGDGTAEAYVAYDDAIEGRRPAVLIAHQWAGQSDFERGKAEALARLGYVGVAIDLYGKAVFGDLGGDNTHLMQPLLEDRGLLRRRLLAAVDRTREGRRVDPERIAVIGYCLGGLCALDVARANAPGVRGVVSFHGLFAPPNLGPQGPIAAKVLILHGYDDPMAPPEDVLAVARELTEAMADWQLHAYGHTLHAFTAEGVNAPERGVQYNVAADRRSWQAMENFLAEVLS